MARKYTRDNRGRFAATGATARGGRLRTASGGKRATQTAKMTQGVKGTVGKPKGLKPQEIGMAAQSKMGLANRRRTSLSPDAFAKRAKRASSAGVRRYINESDRNNNLPSGPKRESLTKREMATNKRNDNTAKTSQRAREFYARSGSAGSFARKPVERTSQSPNFGAKKASKRSRR